MYHLASQMLPSEHSRLIYMWMPLHKSSVTSGASVINICCWKAGAMSTKQGYCTIMNPPTWKAASTVIGRIPRILKLFVLQSHDYDRQCNTGSCRFHPFKNWRQGQHERHYIDIKGSVCSWIKPPSTTLLRSQRLYKAITVAD